MTLTLLKPQDYVVSAWSGGETTQLAIDPPGALYADRQFRWRISSATVDLEESDFTALPDYNRYIATLEGQIRVSHNGGEPVELPPYLVHGFDGGWETKSVGRCRDFNLMLRKGQATGALLPVEDTACTYTTPVSHTAAALVYCAVGAARVQFGEETVTLQAGETLLLREAPGVSITVDAAGAKAMAAWMD